MNTRIQHAQSSKTKWATLKRMGTTKQKRQSLFNYFTADQLNTHFAATVNRHPSITSLDINAALQTPHPTVPNITPFNFRQMDNRKTLLAISKLASKSMGHDAIS